MASTRDDEKMLALLAIILVKKQSKKKGVGEKMDSQTRAIFSHKFTR